MVVSELADKSSLILAYCSLACGPSANRMNCTEEPVGAHELIRTRITSSWRDLTVCVD